MRLTLALLLLCSTASADSAKTVFKQAAAYSVGVMTEDGSGSGTIVATVGDSAYVLTCFHVIDGDKNILITYDDEGEKIQSSKADVIAVDKVHDLALLRAANPKHRPAAKIADLEPEVYDELYIVSCPLGLQRQAATERLTAKDLRGRWTFTGMSIFGMSGGAIMNDRAQVACVIRGMAADEDGATYTQMGYCVPLEYVKTFLKGLPK